MSYSEVVVLVPSHSLEDFPTDLTEKHAASLLNCFAVAFHPQLIAQAGVPNWRRADDSFEEASGKLVLVPTCSDDRLPFGWVQKAREQGGTIVTGLDDRQQLLTAALVNAGNTAAPTTDVATTDVELALLPAVSPDGQECPSDNAPELDPELVADFLALGTSWLQLELLTRHMHHYSSYDDTFFRKSAVDGAQAAIAGDAGQARDRLRACFDLLTEARERFYPVNCFLIDLCLLVPENAGDPLKELLIGTTPVNYLLKAEDAERIATDRPDLIALLKEAWARGAADIVGGDWREIASPLVPLESTLHDLERGRQVFQKHFGRRPTTWARRRFGLSLMMPQILQKYGYHSGLHFLLDDGIYPDREQCKMRWEGCDNSSLDCNSRIPLAADAATTYLRLPQRMAETMQSDTVAALVIARYPEVKSPFFHDLHRMQKYSPVLGKAVSFDEYFQHSEHSGGGWGSDSKDYLAPFFTQSVARREKRAVSRYVQHVRRNAQFEAAAWQASITCALYGRPVDVEREAAVRDVLEAAGPDAFDSLVTDAGSKLAQADQSLTEFRQQAESAISKLVLHGASNQAGYLLTNSLSFLRRVVVELPADAVAPAIGGPVKAVQFDTQHKHVVVEIPPAGFAWIADGSSSPSAPAKAASGKPNPPLAEGPKLQNEFFEVFISEATGGLQKIKKHGREPNRLSQQLAFRFPREKSYKRGEGDAVEEVKTWYSEMRCTSLKVTSSGPALGEIVTQGEIFDPSNNSKLADFRQTFRVWLGRPFLELDVEITPVKLPEGDPWSNYYGSRFAWNDSTAALSGSLYGAAQPIRMERIESPNFLEIATETERTTILPMGLPFHRKTGPKMLDSILLVDGETERRFQFVIGLDQNFPQQAALENMTPTPVIRTTLGPPKSGPTGWFYHCDSRCVQITKLVGLITEPNEHSDDWMSEADAVPPTPSKGFGLRLQETEGRYQSVYVELFRQPASARVRDFRGRTISDLPPAGDGFRAELAPFAIVDVEVLF